MSYSMSTVIFLVMRRMRVPLLVLLSVYSITIIGITLIPGVDDQGQEWYMSFFHAFYFVSFMGTTIGFGEIPYEFSDAQRMWVTFSMYLAVVSWIYAIGALLALVQDKALQRAFTLRRFSQTVKHIHEPFYLVCGYGDTGRALVSDLEERFTRSVVIELEQEHIDLLTMENYPVYVPSFCADASKPSYLIEGGLKNPHCAGVVAITNNNLANLHIAITTKLMNPKLKAICRVESHEIAANMGSFGTDYIINPFDIFAAQLRIVLHIPSLHLLREWLTGRRKKVVYDQLVPPKRGLWILCGYGRFGKAVHDVLKNDPNIQLVVIEVAPEEKGYPRTELVTGRGTEAITLLEAHVKEAVGIIAGTADDIDNLSIVMTARGLNPDLFVVIRQNIADNSIIFEAAKADIVMQASQIIADYIRILLSTPLLNDFMSMTRLQDNDWTNELSLRLDHLIDAQRPKLWEISITEKNSPAITQAIEEYQTIRIEQLLADPCQRDQNLAHLPLFLLRGKEKILLPHKNTKIAIGDKILWCGTQSSKNWLEWTQKDHSILAYIITGQNEARSYIWRWAERRYRSYLHQYKKKQQQDRKSHNETE